MRHLVAALQHGYGTRRRFDRSHKIDAREQTRRRAGITLDFSAGGHHALLERDTFGMYANKHHKGRSRHWRDTTQ